MDNQSSKCRFCSAPLEQVVVDLGMSPLCQTQIKPTDINKFENFYPLRIFVCTQCFLVQLDEYVTPRDIFSEYAYFSSYSDSWVEHARLYCEKMIVETKMSSESLVMEIASNDGYLLQHFLQSGFRVLGIEPAANVAQSAIEKGIKTEIQFLGERTAQAIVKNHGQASLVVGNNVLAHVPDINDFVKGIKILLQPDGIVTMEFPHLMQLMTLNQFDTIYHEHFSYLSWHSVQAIFSKHGLTLFNVEELDTHGGSLRIYGCHHSDRSKTITSAVDLLTRKEADWGVTDPKTYTKFTERVTRTKHALVKFLIEQKEKGKSIVGYGAPGKGNTLLNYCGIRTDFLDYTVDRNPYKQGTYTPGTRIPIFDPSKISQTQPDFVLILPWNLKAELSTQLDYVREWGGKLVFPIPELTIE